jgi:lysophospholipase L1-like esterase
VKFGHAILLLVLLLSLWPAAPTHAQELLAPRHVYLALGDSLALGVEAPANNDGQPGYPALVLESLQRSIDPDITYSNLGVSGEWTGSFLAGQMAAAEASVASHNAAGRCVVATTLSIGGNDFGRILAGESSADVAIPALTNNLSQILQRLTTVLRSQSVPNCSARIAMIDYYNPYPGLRIPPSNQTLSDIYQPQLNSIIRQTAAQWGVAVANVAMGFAGREAQLLYVNQGIYSNPLLLIPFLPWFEGAVDFHPRPAGHAVIAGALWSALGMVRIVPTLEEIPDLFAPTVNLVAPWACGECEVQGQREELLLLPALAEPGSHTIEWLGVQLWNRVTRPLVCWLLALFQAGLNVYAQTLNTYWLPSINDLYRLLYGLFFWLTSALTAFFHLGEDMRGILWAINGNMSGGGATATGMVTSVGTLADESFAALLDMLSGALAAWHYMLALWIGGVTDLVSGLLDLETVTSPAQLVALESFWLLAALRGVARGMFESDLGWWFYAQIGLLYFALLMQLVDETGDMA